MVNCPDNLIRFAKTKRKATKKPVQKTEGESQKKWISRLLRRTKRNKDPSKGQDTIA
jgi:hypothetical protein